MTKKIPETAVEMTRKMLTKGENKKVEHETEEREIELRKLQEIAQLSSIYYRDLQNFERNPRLSHLVHVVMNVVQFICILHIEIFHHVHGAINERMKEADPNRPDLPEGRNPVFFVYPISMTISLTLAIFWLVRRTFWLLIQMTLAGCAAGIIMMLLAGIVEMRHAEIYINLEKITDSELKNHPVFLHNFSMCIISIIAMLFYLVHFWITFDCWRWHKKERRSRQGGVEGDDTCNDYTAAVAAREGKPETSNDDFNDIPPWDLQKKKWSDADETNFETEPAILYCFIVDCCRYIRDRDSRKPIHEFQVVHVK
ncbi:uncharacterized protein [Venturia canescens]|uniref:uncharacterized protein isoform X1 n=1 Tax=Venturia canescens TaxID=32260 RepID=UPI001C9C3EB7|nr:uncharacterized protein LOC122410712 isoform X1 [Venturia canescens]